MFRIPTTPALIMVMVCLFQLAGCTSLYEQNNQTPNSPPEIQQFPSSYQVTIAQPDLTSGSIKMDTDVFNIGEVVEFYVVNEGSKPLTCLNDPPTYSVKFQSGSGRWATRMGTDVPVETNKTSLGHGQTSQMYRFVTSGWEPNRYRIVSDCGVSREFLLRAAPTPVPTICPPAGNEPVRVRINPIGTPYAGTPFVINGTTNQAAGEELKYLVFPGSTLPKAFDQGGEKPLSTQVSAGVCGENVWSVSVSETIPQDYYLMISAGSLNATAIQRFTVVPSP